MQRLEDLMFKASPTQQEIEEERLLAETGMQEYSEMLGREELLSEIMRGDEEAGLYDVSVDEDVPEIPDYLLYDPEVVGYPDQEMQDEIYRWALEGIMPLAGPFVVVDIGCGRCDLQRYIENLPYVASAPYISLTYHGYDSNPVMIGIARKLYLAGRLKEFSAEDKDFLELEGTNFNDSWGFWIGTMNDLHTNQLVLHIRKGLEVCEKGLVFILNSDNDNGFSSYDKSAVCEMMNSFFPDQPYKIDAAKYRGIYKLTIFNERFPD